MGNKIKIGETMYNKFDGSQVSDNLTVISFVKESHTPS